MKLTKRMKNAIIQSTIANAVFLLILAIVILFFCLPRVFEVEEKKAELGEIYGQYSNIDRNGITFQELKQTVAKHKLSGDAYISTILRNTDTVFYDKVFSSDGSKKFDEFLTDKSSEIDSIKASDEYVKKDETLGSLLPLYTQDSSFGETGITDFHFTNYVENIIYTFNLNAVGEIGIGNIEKIGADENDPNVAQKAPTEESDLDEAIFKIPLSFELAGQKSDVVDFLHFFENVGSIGIDGANLEIYDDSFVKKVLEGDSYSSEYNIYKNQVADIEVVEMDSYPDSSPLSSTKDLITLLKNDQAREKMELKVDLNFYVAGVPTYRMELFVNEFLNKFTQLSQKISSDTKKYTAQAYKYSKGEQIQAINKLQNIESLMLAENNNILELRKQLLKKQDIQKVYNAAIDYADVLNWIEQDYKKQIELLTKES